MLPRSCEFLRSFSAVVFKTSTCCSVAKTSSGQGQQRSCVYCSRDVREERLSRGAFVYKYERKEKCGMREKASLVAKELLVLIGTVGFRVKKLSIL